jgi:PAS domain S-box-containing protein
MAFQSGRIKGILILVSAPLFVYLALLNLSDRSKWKTPQDGLVFSQTERGIELAFVDSSTPDLKPRVGDLLVDINGLSLRTVDDYLEVIEALSLGSSEHFVADYTFRGRNGGSEATYPVRIERTSQFSGRDIPLMVVAFAFLAVGVVVFMRAGHSSGVFHFALICLIAFILLQFRHSGRADTFDIFVYWLSAVTLLLLPPLFLHFCLVFPGVHKWLQARSAVITVAYIPAAILLITHVGWFFGRLQGIGLPRTPHVGHFLDKIEILHFVVYFGIAMLAVAGSRKHATGAVQRKQMQWITVGTSLGILPFVAFYAIPFLFGVEIRSWMEASVLALILLPLSFGYAIARFRLRDVDLIFKRGVAYVIASSAVLAFYVGITVLIARVVQDISPRSEFFLLALSALVVAFLFAPLRDRIQEQLDRYFYRDRYVQRKSFREFSETLGSEIDLSRLTSQISDRVQQTLDVSPVAIYLKDDLDRNVFHLETYHGLQTLDQPSSVDITDDDLRGLGVTDSLSGRFSTRVASSTVRAKLGRWGIRYIEPLSVRGRTIGFVGLGRRKNGDVLTSEEIEMMATLARYAAIAIDNAHLYRSLESKASELMQLQAYSENVVESINLGVAVVSASGEITVWNSTMTAITGITNEQAEGMSISEVLPADLASALEEVKDGSDWLVDGVRRIYKTHIETDDGKLRLINVVLTPFISVDSINTGTLLVVDDITEKVRLENQLQQAEKLSSIGLFAAGLAHEVNTPLAGISSYAQMLIDETPSDDPRRDLLERIEIQTFRASEIVNNLLNFARFSDSDYEEINVNSLMMDTLSLLKHQLRNANIEIDLECDPTLPRTIGNGGKLQQVFMNLFINAKDSMPQGGRLRLRTLERDSELFIEVRDTGTGISKEDIKRIYDPFFTTKSVGKGTGLGLSVSYGIIQEHSGRISVESELGKGTTFLVALPLRRVN